MRKKEKIILVYNLFEFFFNNYSHNLLKKEKEKSILLYKPLLPQLQPLPY